jgi:DNA repair photolyase
MKLEFREYQPRKIVNVHKHVDGPWFWGKYSAHPYVGCRSGCEFCYLRGYRYLGGRDPETFDTQIQVKVNAVELMSKELTRLKREVIACGDWQQPAEDRYQLSRRMLAVVHEFGFPLFIVERSPLLTRDLDLLVEINRRTWVGVVYSISSLDPELKRVFEPRSPGVKRRLLAMKALAEAGILVGTSLMPIFPFIGDDESHLGDVVQATVDHGGSFVMAGGLTMDGVQAERTFEAARRLNPSLDSRWRKLYNWEAGGKPRYGPPRAYNARLGGLVRELCERHSILDRMPRYIAPGPLAINTRVAERLFLKTYDLELDGASDSRIWAYRRAAWTVDEMPDNIAEIYKTRGKAGLVELPGIGERLAGLIAVWLREFTAEVQGESPPGKETS